MREPVFSTLGFEEGGRHPGPTLATAARLRELVRRIGPDWDVLALLGAVIYDWEPRLAVLVPPVPATLPGEIDAAQTPSQARHSGALIFGDEPYKLKSEKGEGRRK